MTIISTIVSFAWGFAFGGYAMYEIRRRVYQRSFRSAFIEGRDGAIANAAMVAHDMGRPDIRAAINALITDKEGL